MTTTLSKSTEVYITDKTEKPMFKTLCATAYYESEVRNLHRKLIEAEKYPEAYKFLDLDTARIVINHL